ncbi:MAG: alcohol dehydrogenase catalytic domain-containing protein [Bifidobacteriaceae bacterium]|jgi:2-desacetyl-2-hydroxyethyl bacteriochlorophyllide A dehydrogenase|nr:alcohol dehydrogenase catalytic domain-containing protein [Bifidobacteriaceae bacterium]
MLRQIPTASLALAEVPRPAAPSPDDVVIRVEACGICGTDLHIMQGLSYRPELPFVLGHEPVGTVVEAGSRASEWLGKRVTITLFTGDGTCPECLAGNERLCPNVVSDTGVFNAWGGYADYLAVHAAQLLEVPDSLTSPQAASLVDAGATAANSVRVAMEREPRRVLILGAGPIGLMSAELLTAHGVEAQLTQRSARRRATAQRWGYQVFEQIAQAPGPFDAVIDATGSPAVFNDGVKALGPRGRYILAGYAQVPNADFAEVSHKEVSIWGIRSGSRDDLRGIVDLAASGQIRLPEIDTWPLEQINDAIEALRSRRVDGKAVIVPGPAE